MNRNIIHIDVTDFHIAVERVLDPRLRERPVIVSVETATRSLVYAVSAEARQNGIFRGMSLQQARKNCRDVIVLPPNENLYLRATVAILKILYHFSPIIEPLRFGHAYLDMTGSGKLFGSVKDAAAKAQKEIQNLLCLDANAGVAGNKLVSKVASDVVSNSGQSQGLCDVHHGNEERFLAPLHVGYLPGVKKDFRERLLDLNVRIIRELAAVASEHLQMVFGRFGIVLHQRSHGIDFRPVQPSKRAPEVVEVDTLQDDSNDYFMLRARLFRLLAQGTRRLREKQLFATRLAVGICYSDYKENIAQQKIAPAHDEQVLSPVAEKVLQQALNRRIRVRKITLKLDRLTPAPQQLSLFEQPQNPKIVAITAAMDKIRSRYGEEAIRFGRAA